MPPKQHQYIGNGKFKSFPNGGEVINCSICLDDIESLPHDTIDHAKNGKRYLNFTVAKRQKASEWGDTHGIYVDEYYIKRGPRGQSRGAQPSTKPGPSAAPAAAADFDDDDVPW